MTRSLAAALLFVAAAGCSQMPPMPFGLGGWTTLIDRARPL